MDLLLRRRMMMAPAVREEYIIFADPVVGLICATNWGDGVGITPSQAARVTSLASKFLGNTQITSFDELEYFTGLTTLGNNMAFQNCTALASFKLPMSLTDTGGKAFSGCTALTGSLSISVDTIGQESFRSTGYTDVTVDCITLGASAFRGISTLRTVDVSARCTSVGGVCFGSSGSASNKTTFYFRSITPPALANSNAFTANNINKIYVPSGSVNAYKTASNWSTFASYIEAIPS